MARKVVWTETAWRDLDRCAEYIAGDSPGYAAAFVQRITKHARSLDELSQRGRVVPELGATNIRELLIGSYRLIFEVQEKTVYVLALVHAARDLPTLWRLEGRSETEKPS
jgi:plasmid stabilization system protein ParE